MFVDECLEKMCCEKKESFERMRAPFYKQEKAGASLERDAAAFGRPADSERLQFQATCEV